jgi:hypothetical protein
MTRIGFLGGDGFQTSPVIWWPDVVMQVKSSRAFPLEYI